MSWIRRMGFFKTFQILKLLINHIENPDDEAWKGYFYAFALFMAGVLDVFGFSHYVMQLTTIAIQIRSSLVSAIVQKSLKLSNAARQKFTTGEITNLISVDSQNILDNFPYLFVLWGAPLQIVLAFYMLYNELGIVPMLFGLLGIVVMFPGNIIGGNFVTKCQEKQLKEKDLRIKVDIHITSFVCENS